MNKTLLKEHSQLIISSMLFALYLAHTLLFHAWIIDDAGISFVYARNLAAGHGLVPQPGATPIEGYSNLSWVLLLSPFFLLRLFHPLIIPKLISALLVWWSFWLIANIIQLTTHYSRIFTVFTLGSLATNTSFVVWTCSGMENPLTVFLGVLLCANLIDFREKSQPLIASVYIACVVFLIILTRPEGILAILLFPCALLLYWLLQIVSIKQTLQLLALYCISILFLIACLCVFRVAYFGDWMPNTYYAKHGYFLLEFPFRELVRKFYEKTNVLVDSIYPFGDTWFPPALFAGIVLFFNEKKRTSRVTEVFLFLAYAYATYLLLPIDWMREFRLASLFFVFLYIFLAILIDAGFVFINSNKSGSRYLRAGSLLFLALVISLSIRSFVKRSFQYAQSPDISFTMVRQQFGARFNEYTAFLGLKTGSFLVADVGGAFFESALQIINLAGETDREIARTLEQNHPAFLEYIFEEKKPTFIVTHGWWTYVADLAKDPRFSRDYVAIHESPDQWIAQEYSVAMNSGAYVRREVVGDKLEGLRELYRRKNPGEPKSE